MDRDVVLAAQGGDRDAFATLARSHGGRLYAIALRTLRDTGLAEDAVQQALIVAWRELPGLRDPDRFAAWINRVLVREAYAVSGKRARATPSTCVLPVDGPAAPDGCGWTAWNRYCKWGSSSGERCGRSAKP